MTPEQIKEQRDWLDTLTGYTPTPWTFEMEQGEWPDYAIIGGDGDAVLLLDYDLGFRVHDANARLIAAAPDLHAALTAALDEIERLREAHREIVRQFGNTPGGHVAAIISSAALKGDDT